MLEIWSGFDGVTVAPYSTVVAPSLDAEGVPPKAA